MRQILSTLTDRYPRLDRLPRVAGGVALIVLGVAGLPLPLVPTGLPILLGVTLIAPDCRLARWTRRQTHNLRERWLSDPGPLTPLRPWARRAQVDITHSLRQAARRLPWPLEI